MILYINNEHCSSVEQLKGYFKLDLTPDCDIYADLLDYGKHGDIAVWLREMEEPELADRVDTIPNDLDDSVLYSQLKAAILGTEIKETSSLKPSFDKCFVLEDVKCDMNDNEAKVSVMLKVQLSVNEKYELSVSSNWGTRAEIVNPYHYAEGKTATIEFTLRKRPGKEIGEIAVKAEGTELSHKKITTTAKANKEILIRDINSFFPIKGITLGKTTWAEAERLGFNVERYNNGSSRFVSFSGQQLWDHGGCGIFTSIYATHDVDIFPLWKNLGMSWELSWEGWLQFFRKHRFSIEIESSPYIRYYDGRDTLSGSFKAISSDGSICFILKFNYGNRAGEGYSVLSKNTLYSMTIKSHE